MIYLIDDKKNRQEKDYKWTEARFLKYKSIITTYHTFEDFKDDHIKKEIFREENFIFFHTSFFDNPVNSTVKDSNTIISKIESLAKEKNIYVAFFSGSNSSSKTGENIIYLKDAKFYSNLEHFLHEASKGNYNLLNLLNTDNYEDKLREKIEHINGGFDESEISTSDKVFFVADSDSSLEIPIEINNTEKILIEESSDKYLDEFVLNQLNNEEYDKLIIPLYFGDILSEFNGLRLACHIRCTLIKNQLKPIYIYGFKDYEKFLDSEYFNILKTKGVFLIDYTFDALKDCIISKNTPLDYEELKYEILKLNLDVPSNYEDNHSVANEFGIYQLTYSAGFKIDNITDFNTEKLKTLYFKWLITKNGLQEPLPVKEQEKNKSYRKKLSGIKQVGKIDLSKISKK